MGDDRRPPMLPKFLDNYEAQKRHEHMNMNICLSYFLHMMYQMNVGYQWLWTDTTLQGSEIISSKSCRDFA